MSSQLDGWKRLLFVLLALAFIPGCGGGKLNLYSEATTAFKRGVDAADTILQEELMANHKIRRTLAVIRYVNQGNETTNIDQSDLKGSFARFACAGVGDFDTPLAALTTYKTYAEQLENLAMMSPDDTGFAMRLAIIQELRQKGGPLEIQKPDPEAFETCTNTVRDFIPLKGLELAPPEPEFVPAAVFAAIASFKAIYDAAKFALDVFAREAEAAARAKAVSAYIKQNKETIQNTLDALPTEADFEKLRRLRQRAALVSPYYGFKALLNLSRTNQEEQIITSALQTHTAFEEFDSLYRRPPTKGMTKTLRRVQQELERLANNDLKPEEALAVFIGFIDTLGELFEAVEGLREAVEARNNSMSG